MQADCPVLSLPSPQAERQALSCAASAWPYPDSPCVLQMPPRAASTFPLAVAEPACTKKKQSLKIVAREVWLFTELCVPTLQQLQES